MSEYMQSAGASESKKDRGPHAQRSTTDLLLLIGAIGIVLVNVVTAYHTSSKVDAVKEQSAATAAQVAKSSEKADEKLDVIHELTNSNLSSVNKQLELANVRIEKLEKLLSEEKQP